MRITGGEWGGRQIRVPKSGVRPSQDRLRQALFSSLGAAVAGARVLDLFAGSGALGLEALSRGAAFTCWVEQHPKAFETLRENVRALNGEDCTRALCVRGDAMDLPALERTGRVFDLVLADPPYETGACAGLLPRLLAALAQSPLLAPEGLLMYEQSADEPPAAAPGWELLRDRTMGGSRWLLYRRCAAPSI